jgi:hypothetical protein
MRVRVLSPVIVVMTMVVAVASVLRNGSVVARLQ